MENKNKKGAAALLKGKGLYAALILCIAAAGVASWSAVNSTIKELKNQQPLANSKEVTSWAQDVEKKQEDVKITEGFSSSSKESSQQPSSSGAQGASDNATGQQQQPAASFQLPADGEILAAFSGSELVYNDTMADWRTHNGIDIAAVKDTAVKAAAQGEVTRVYDDALWGTVVEQKSGDLTLRYTGLNKEVSVHEGDTLAVGQTIGRVGEIPAEAKLAPHIHFEVLKGAAYQDPAAMAK